MILQIIDVMRALDYIQGSSLTADEKRTMAFELRSAIPAKALCASAQLTHDIVDARLRAICEKPVSDNESVSKERSATASPQEAQENRKEGHPQPGPRQGKDGVSRDDRKALGGPKKVARG